MTDCQHGGGNDIAVSQSRFLPIREGSAAAQRQSGYLCQALRRQRTGRLTENEAEFIASRDSIYIVSVGAGGWPYVQHRGGPIGFVKVLSERTIGFADFRGNRQYVSVGNLVDDNRVALFIMDYARRARLKLLGRARVVDLVDAPELAAALIDRNYGAKVERALLILRPTWRALGEQ